MAEISVEDLPIRPTLMWEGVPLFDVSGGIRIVEYCESNNIAILGMEGFNVKDNKRIPDMDCIVDFSASLNEECFAKKSLEASRHIMNSMANRAILLEFVLVKV